MAKARVTLHSKGFRELMNSPAVLADLDRRGRAIAAATGHRDEYGVDTNPGKKRGRTGVFAKTARANRRNLDNHELLRALDAGR